LLQGNLVDYQYSFNDFSTDFDAEPARMRGDTTVGGPIYLVEQSNGAPFINPGPRTGIRVIMLSNELSNNPVFTPFDIPVNLYDEPVGASQPGGFPIATNTSFIVSVDWRNGVLAAAHNVSVADDGFTTTRARWYELNADAAGAQP